MERSLQGLCFDKITEAKCDPKEDLGLCEELSLQYYRDLTDKLKAEVEEASRKADTYQALWMSKANDMALIIDMIKTTIVGDPDRDEKPLGVHICQLIKSGHGALKCPECNLFTMVEDGQVWDFLLDDRKLRWDIRKVLFMIDSLCVRCWHAHNKDYPRAELFAMCKKCFKNRNEGFSLLNATASAAMDLDNWFLINEAKDYNGNTSFIGCLCRGCYEASQ